MRDPRLVRMYRVLDSDIASLDDRIRGGVGRVRKLFIPSKSRRRLLQSELDTLAARQKALDAPDEVFGIIKDHFADFLEELQYSLDSRYTSPANSMRDRGFITLVRENDRPAETRVKLIEERFAQYEQLFTAMFDWLPELPAEELIKTLGAFNSLGESVLLAREEAGQFMQELGSSGLEDLKLKMQSFADTDFSKWNTKLQELSAAKGEPPTAKEWEDGDRVSVDVEAYRKALKVHGVDLDDLLGWYEAEVEKTRDECFDIANALDILEKPVTTMTQVNDILFKYAGPAGSPEEMFARATEYVTRATAAAREYVWLPEDAECLPIVMEKQMKKTYPWGAGGSCDPNRRPFEGRFMLNDENYRAITDGWIKINCCHEVHPGHYTQYLRAILDPLPETFRRGAKHTCITEAMCVRTEKLMEPTFAEDPFYPLFTAYRRHHTSVRIMADVYMQYLGKTVGELIKLYTDELGFDPVTIRKLVPAHTNGIGYFTTYYYGYKKITEWEKLYGFNKYEYTELLFSAGRVSLSTFERYLRLSEADRFSLTHEFAAMKHFR